GCSNSKNNNHNLLNSRWNKSSAERSLRCPRSRTTWHSLRREEDASWLILGLLGKELARVNRTTLKHFSIMRVLSQRSRNWIAIIFLKSCVWLTRCRQRVVSEPRKSFSPI